jgi:hypothetical protein
VENVGQAGVGVVEIPADVGCGRGGGGHDGWWRGRWSVVIAQYSVFSVQSSVPRPTRGTEY